MIFKHRLFYVHIRFSRLRLPYRPDRTQLAAHHGRHRRGHVRSLSPHVHVSQPVRGRVPHGAQLLSPLIRSLAYRRSHRAQTSSGHCLRNVIPTSLNIQKLVLFY